jgi:hypothetical protein
MALFKHYYAHYRRGNFERRVGSGWAWRILNRSQSAGGPLRERQQRRRLLCWLRATITVCVVASCAV